MMSSVFSALEAFTQADVLINLKRGEDAAWRGSNRMVTWLIQTIQAKILLDGLSKLEETSGQILLSTGMRRCIYLSNWLINAAESQTNKWKEERVEAFSFFNKKVTWLQIHQGFAWTNHHIGSLYQVAAIATHIAFLYLGCQVYAYTSLAVLSLGYLERRNYLPTRVREVYIKMAPVISTVGSLLYSSSYFIRAMTVLNLVGWAGDILNNKMLNKKIPYHLMKPISSLNYEQFGQIMEGSAKVEINCAHVNIEPFPVVSDCQTFCSLKQLIQDFDWRKPEFLTLLEKELNKDARWRGSSEYGQIRSAKNQGTPLSANEIQNLKIAYAQAKIDGLINDVEKETIQTGSPLNYKVIKNYLGYISQELPHASCEQQDQLITRLAVDGGDYCGPGIYVVLESIAFSLLSQSLNHKSLSPMNDDQKARLPLLQRILLILQQERLRIVEAFHVYIIPTVDPIGNGVWDGKRGDVHAFNRTIKLFAWDFGVPDQGADQDLTFKPSIMERYFYRYAGLTTVEFDFLWKKGYYRGARFEGYTVDRIMGVLGVPGAGGIGSSLIPTQDIFKWAQDWINKVAINSDQAGSIRETFLENLVDGTTYESNGQFKQNFICAMLVDMGILTIVKK